MNFTQINLAGLDLINDDYQFVLSGLWDSEKDITTNDFLIDGLDYGSSKNKPKTLILTGVIKSKDINKIFKFNSIIAQNGLKALTIYSKDMEPLRGFVEVQNRITNNNPRAVSCQLVLFDPFLYSLNNAALQLGATNAAGLIFPLTFPVDFGEITGANGILINSGNAVSYPTIEIVGECSNIEIINNTTGESIGIIGALSQTDKLIIDCVPKTRGVYLNNNLRMDLKTGAGWIRCEPGENQFIFNRSSLEDKKHCIISLKSRWI